MIQAQAHTQHFPEAYSPEAAFRASIDNRSSVRRLTTVPAQYSEQVTIEQYNQFLSDRYENYHRNCYVMTLNEWLSNKQ